MVSKKEGSSKGKTVIERDVYNCVICGKTNKDVTLIGIDDKYICYECVKMLSAFARQNDIHRRAELCHTPKDIYNYLSERVIGQEEAKKQLSVSAYNHMKRINDDANSIRKSNVIMVGPSGSGKTLIGKALAEAMSVPFICVDATAYTQSGYVGEDVESIITRLITAANGDVELAQNGVVFIDEIDKIGRKGENPSITRDVSGEGVQQAILKLVEGNIVNVPPREGRKHPQEEYIRFDTSNVLFICAGAFEGMLDVDGSSKIGFGSRDNSSAPAKRQKKAMTEDFYKYGMIPELIGRFPVIVQLDALTEEDLVKILTDPKGSIVKEYQHLFAQDNIDLTFTNEALRYIAHEAILRKTGARGLRAIIEDVLLDTMFQAPDNPDVTEYIVTKDFVEERIALKTAA